MIGKYFKDIQDEDLVALIANGIPEGKTIEYKRDLPGNADLDKKEFLADVSSFANTFGGDLIFGIEERGGIPFSVAGLATADVDQEISRLDNMLASGLQPRIRHETRSISLQDKKILIIRVERSWVGPHRVIFSGHDKFYGRTSAGKYPLDVSELRTAFGFSQNTVERIRAFRAERVMALAANDTPVQFNDGGKLVLHCIPFQSVAPGQELNLEPYYRNPQKIPIMRWQGMQQHRINLEGMVIFAGGASYTQLYRSGILESVEGDLLNLQDNGISQIPSIAYEQVVLEHLPKCLELLSELAINPPVAVALTLVNVLGKSMGVSGFFDFKGYPIAKSHLVLPEAVVDNLRQDQSQILKPLFDRVWNACGYPASRNFDNLGEWSPPSARRF